MKNKPYFVGYQTSYDQSIFIEDCVSQFKRIVIPGNKVRNGIFLEITAEEATFLKLKDGDITFTEYSKYIQLVFHQLYDEIVKRLSELRPAQ